MVNTALPEDLGSMGVRSYIHDALQVRCAGIGVEDARMPTLCGKEAKHLSMRGTRGATGSVA